MFDWKKISQDPASDEADSKWLQWYDNVCTSWDLYSPSPRDERIISLIRNSVSRSTIKLLDIGFVEHSIERTSSPEWFHRKLRDQKDFDVSGADLLANDVEKIARKYSYPNCYVSDATDENSDPIGGGQFDAIHAGDIIEHLDNLKGFFGFLRKNLCEDGICVITTPNPHSIFRMFRFARFGGAVANFEHVSWISPTNMNELCRRYDFEFSCSVYSVKNRLKSGLLRVFGGLAFKYRDLYFDEFTYVIRRTQP